MRVLASLAIVLLHTVQYNVEAFDVKGIGKIASLSIRNSLMWAVPVFIMITGALLLNPNYTLTYKKLFQRYILRILFILLFSVFLGNAADIFVLKTQESLSLGAFLRKVLRDYFTAGGWKSFWYLYLLVALYVTLPLFKSLTESRRPKDVLYLVCVLFLFQSVVPTFTRLFDVESGFYSLIFSVYPLYLLMGYLLFAEKNYSNWGSGIYLVILILSLGLEAGLTVMCFLHGWLGLFEELSVYTFPATALQAATIFVLGQKHFQGTNRLLLDIDRYSLEIYLIHIFLLQFAIHSLHFNPYVYGGWMIPTETIALFLISYRLAKLPVWIRGLI